MFQWPQPRLHNGIHYCSSPSEYTVRSRRKTKNGNVTVFSLQLRFYSKVTISWHEHWGERCEMHYSFKHHRAASLKQIGNIVMVSDVISLEGCKTTNPFWDVCAWACFADISAIVKNLFQLIFFLLLMGSNHGQPSSDQPSVTDPWGNVSLQHPVGWKLHSTVAWCL